MILEKHERFWTNRFGQGNAGEFEQWVPGGTESRKALSKIVADLGIRTILDVGCGLALDYEQYVVDRLDVEYHGVDLTYAFVKEVRWRYPGLDVRLASAGSLPYDSDAFDAVSCRHLLEHLQTPEAAFAEMVRVSKRYVIVTWFIPPSPNPTEISLHGRGPGVTLYKNRYSCDYMDALAEKNSLTLVRARCPVGGDVIHVWEKML